MERFEDFLRRREAASNDYIAGDATALRSLLTTRDPATFMPPGGGVVEGAAAATDAQAGGAAAFGPSSTGRFEVLASGSGDDLAYWTGRQVASMDVLGRDGLVDMVLRVTEVFRREDGSWRLVHRHADLVPPA